MVLKWVADARYMLANVQRASAWMAIIEATINIVRRGLSLSRRTQC